MHGWSEHTTSRWGLLCVVIQMNREMYGAPGQYRPIEYAEANENLVEDLSHTYSVSALGWTCLFDATGTVNSGHDFVTACIVFFAGRSRRKARLE